MSYYIVIRHIKISKWQFLLLKWLIACLFHNIDQYDRLRKVLNAAARVTCLIPKFAHITPVLRELHWLPVKFRVEFKIALLVFKTLNGLAPQYLSELLVVKPRTRYSLRSDSETLLVIPKVTRKTFGDRAFFHAGPTLWNALPSSHRNRRNIDSFKVQLKTCLFKKAFNL